METLAKKLLESKIELINCDKIDDGNYAFNGLNKNLITVKKECKHELERRISTLYNKKDAIVCKTCKKENKYGFNTEDKTITCKDCGHVNNDCKGVNLHLFRCRQCKLKEDKAETDLYKRLCDLGFKVCKNYRFKDDGSLTGDLYFEMKEKTIVIEVDDNNHKKVTLESHLTKDGIVLLGSKDVRMIRVWNKDIDLFMEHLNRLLEIDAKIVVFNSSKESNNVYKSIYSDCDALFDIVVDKFYVEKERKKKN
jgi:very-short-patch-repair endonuclease/DNA-directed RNA polymerase subunit RPC12/RpoP